MYTGYKKLTVRERKHLLKMNVRTTYDLEENFKGQAEMRKAHPFREPCWDCKNIARKLGYAV